MLLQMILKEIENGVNVVISHNYELIFHYINVKKLSVDYVKLIFKLKKTNVNIMTKNGLNVTFVMYFVQMNVVLKII
jgi:hypothetical protein